ncbi:MAG: two-component regulator propeller domain-containing protein [Bacteroidota bacterium]
MITSYNKSSHGGGTQTWALESTNQGILFAGNNSGVLLFDGHEWDVVPLPNKTFVRSLHQSTSGHLYVGGQNEFGYYINSVVKPSSYKSLKHLIPEEHLDFEDVWKIFEINSRLYFCTERAVFEVEGEECQVISPNSDRFENFFSFSDALYIQELDQGLNVFSSGQSESYLDAQVLRDNRIAEILPWQENSLMIFTQDAGIFVYKEGVLSALTGQTQELVLNSKIYSAVKLANEKVAIGTIQNGLILLSSNGEVERVLTENDGLPNKTVLSICEDRSGNIWLGLDNGLAYSELNSPFSKVSEITGIEGTGYAVLKEGRTSYFGTNLGLFEIIDGQNNITHSKVLTGQIWSLQKMGKGVLISGDGGAKYIIGNSVKAVSDVRSSWRFLQVLGSDNYYLQGTYSGLYLYQRTDTGNLPLKLVGKMAGFDESTRLFEQDSNGNIWVSHAYRGLYRLKPDYSNLEFTEVQSFGSSQGLPDDFYITVSKIRGELVFSTEKGVYQFDESKEEFKEHKELTELLGTNKNVQSLIEDELGNIWFSTDTEFGLVQIKEKGVYNDVELIYFNQIQDDLVDGFENVFTTDENSSYIPIEGGFYKYDLGLVESAPEFEFPLRIKEVFTTRDQDSTIFSYADMDSGKVFKLPPEETDLRFEFNLPTFGKLNEVGYSYKLDGGDNRWSEWTTNHTKEYSNLSSGKYTFTVKAKDGFGRVSQPVEFNFEISPPWFKTIGAQIVFVVLGFLVIVSFVRYVSIKEAKKTEKVKRQSILTIREKEEAYLREKEKSESEIIRLRNEKLRAEVSHKNAELASTTMHLVQKSEMLQNVKKELSELSKFGTDGLKGRIKQIQRLITDDVRMDKNWERFETHFDQVHENFFKNLRSKYPELTPKDQKLCAYLRMNLATKEIAPLLNISVRGVEISRYRLRKKLRLDSEVNLVSFIMEL